jgi:hypothetical protein
MGGSTSPSKTGLGFESASLIFKAGPMSFSYSLQDEKNINRNKRHDNFLKLILYSFAR